MEFQLCADRDRSLYTKVKQTPARDLTEGYLHRCSCLNHYLHTSYFFIRKLFSFDESNANISLTDPERWIFKACGLNNTLDMWQAAKSFAKKLHAVRAHLKLFYPFLACRVTFSLSFGKGNKYTLMRIMVAFQKKK